MKMCKPMYKLGIIMLRIGLVLFVIGLIICLLGKGWITLLIGIGCLFLSVILSNMPNSYLVSFIKIYDESISAKQATDIVQSHLREPIEDSRDTVYFVQGIIDGVEREK